MKIYIKIYKNINLKLNNNKKICSSLMTMNIINFLTLKSDIFLSEQLPEKYRQNSVWTKSKK